MPVLPGVERAGVLPVCRSGSLHRHELLAYRSTQASRRPGTSGQNGRSRRHSSRRWESTGERTRFAESDTVDSVPVAIVTKSSSGAVRGRRPARPPPPRTRFDHTNGRRGHGMDRGRRGRGHQGIAGRNGPADDLRAEGRSVMAAACQILGAGTQQDPASLGPSVTRTSFRRWKPKHQSTSRTLEDVVGGTIARPRAISVLVGVFALVALALAAVGVFGVMAYSVKARTQEISVLVALGAVVLVGASASSSARRCASCSIGVVGGRIRRGRNAHPAAGAIAVPGRTAQSVDVRRQRAPSHRRRDGRGRMCPRAAACGWRQSTRSGRTSPGDFVPRTPLHARSRGPSRPAPLAWLRSLRALAASGGVVPRTPYAVTDVVHGPCVAFQCTSRPRRRLSLPLTPPSVIIRA